MKSMERQEPRCRDIPDDRRKKAELQFVIEMKTLRSALSEERYDIFKGQSFYRFVEHA